jgi:hypothetical protein
MIETSESPLKILSHWHPQKKIWQSNHEQQKIWPTDQTNIWTTKLFIETFYSIFDTNYTSHKIDVQGYTDQSSGYYLIFYGSSHQVTEHHGLAFLTPEIVKKCNDGTLKLLIVFVHETFDSDLPMREWFWDFCNKLTRVGIKKPDSVVILTGTVFEKQAHYDDRCNFIYYPWFEADLQFYLKRQHNNIITPIDFNNKTKQFVNLNLAIRPHRFLMTSYLMFRQISQYGHISWKNPKHLTWREILEGNYRPHYDFSWLAQLSNFDQVGLGLQHYIKTINILKSIQLDNTVLDHATWTGGNYFYQSAWIDLVNETHYELYGNAFLTEKTFKPMAYGLPFIFNASQHHLKAVQQLGYQSFPELFNEQYDNLPSSLVKIATVGNEVFNFCTRNKFEIIKNSPEIQEKIRYNQHLFWNKNHAKGLSKLLYNAWYMSREK